MVGDGLYNIFAKTLGSSIKIESELPIDYKVNDLIEQI